MGATLFSGTKVKALKDKLDLNGAATIDGASVTANTVIIADASKNIISSGTTTTELGYLSGVTSALQTQINNKLASTGGTVDSLTVTGNVSVSGTETINGALTVNNNATVTGNLGVTGTITATGGVTFNGGSTVNGNETVTGTLLVKTALHIEDPGVGTNKVVLQAPTLASDETYTLPSAYPASDGQVLSSTTAGTMSWTSVPTSPSGDVSLTTFAVTASVTNSIYTIPATVNSAHIFWSLRDTTSGAYQAGNSVVINENTTFELANLIAGSASFGGTTLTITSGGVLQLVNPSVSGTFKYRIYST